MVKYTHRQACVGWKRSIINFRKYYLRKISTQIVKTHYFISVENLTVESIMKNHCLSQTMSDVSLAAFYTILEY